MDKVSKFRFNFDMDHNNSTKITVGKTLNKGTVQGGKHEKLNGTAVHQEFHTPACVMGDSWSAVLAVAYWLKKNSSHDGSMQEGKKIVWVHGNRAHTVPPYAGFPSQKLMAFAGGALDDDGDAQSVLLNTCDRLYKNKSFRPLVTEKSDGLENFTEYELGFFRDLQCSVIEGGVLFQDWWADLIAGLAEDANVVHIVDSDLVEFDMSSDGGIAKFAQGETVYFEKFIFADRFKELRRFPKLAVALTAQTEMTRTSHFSGLLQVRFQHGEPVQLPCGIRYILPMTKDAGDDSERHTFGVMLSENASIWNVAIPASDAEDNAILGKRLKKLKQAISKVFDDQPGLQNLSSEQVRFEPMQFKVAESSERPDFAKSADTLWFNDGFGFDEILSMCADVFGELSAEDVSTVDALNSDADAVDGGDQSSVLSDSVDPHV